MAALSGDRIILAVLVVMAVGLGVVAWIGRRLFRRLRRRIARLEGELRDLRSESQRLVRNVYGGEVARASALAGHAVRFVPEFVSQFGEDAFIWDLFDCKTDGFFIEVGAYDGYSLSATYALEAAGWTGLLVEALPDRVAQCRARRPGSTVVQAAVSSRGSTGTATFEAVMGGTDVTSDMVSGLAPKAAQRELIVRFKAKSERIEVPLTTLARLLDGHTGPIDVAIIDVEGSELDVLDGLEIERTRPRVLVVEDLSLGREGAVPAYLDQVGYREVVRFGHNRVYVRSDDGSLLKRAVILAGPSALSAARSAAGTA